MGIPLGSRVCPDPGSRELKTEAWTVQRGTCWEIIIMEWLRLEGTLGIIPFHTSRSPRLLQARCFLGRFQGKGRRARRSLPAAPNRAFAGIVIPRDPSVFLRAVWEGLHSAGSSAAAPAHPHRGEALQVQRLRKGLHRHVHPAPARGGRTFPRDLPAPCSVPAPLAAGISSPGEGLGMSVRAEQ